MKQLDKMLEHVNKDMNAAELARVMEKFEQVCRKGEQIENRIDFCF